MEVSADSNEGSQTSEVSGEWWEKLYRPHYTASDWDALEVKEAIHDEEKDNVYFRIWKEIREKEDRIKRGEITFVGKLRNASTQTDTCIWNAKELEIIKSATVALNGENRRLKAVIVEQNSRLELLDRKCRSEGKALDKKAEKLSEALKANERFAILTGALKEQVLQSRAYVAQLKETTDLIQADLQTARDALKSSKEENVEMEAEKLRVESRLRDVLEDQGRAVQLAAESSRAQLLQENAALCSKVVQLEAALKKEEVRHAASRRGLEHLIAHYAKQQPAQQLEEEVLMAQMQIL